MPQQTAMREDAWTFLCGATEHWKAIVGGSLVFLALGVAASLGFNVPAIISGVSTLCFAVALACFLCWRDEHAKVKELTRPTLRGHILQVAIGDRAGGSGSGITVLMQIVNTGRPTSLEGFGALLTTGERTVDIPTSYLPSDAVFNPNAEGGTPVQISQAEMLYEKAVNPIPEGGRVTGFLLFLAPDISTEELHKECELVVYFRDAMNKQYGIRTSSNWTDAKAELRYTPGVNNPFLKLPTADDASPLLNMSCGRDVTKSIITANNITWFRVQLDSSRPAPIHNVAANVNALRRDGVSLQLNETVNLMLHPGVPVLGELKEGVPGFIDVLRVEADGRATLALAYNYPAVDGYSFFQKGHTYEIDIAVTADAMRTIKCTALFNWTGMRESADFAMLPLSVPSMATSQRLPAS